MSTNTEQRKLAAIMFTDVVGYSALSQRDSKLALELLEEHREILRKIFPNFNGTEIKTIGDAFLVEFQSALEAAECAIAIQRALAKRNADAPANRQIQLRIGVHIGDVVHRDGDVYGDGVNIASRIEPLANPGGICLSMDVERQIRNALEARFEKLAPTELKNISVPMDLFRVVLPWESHTKAEADAPRASKRSPILVVIATLVVFAVLAGWFWMQRSRPEQRSTPTTPTNVAPMTAPKAPDPNSVAVLAFDNLSDDKGSEYFSDGISEELLTVLQKIPGLHVAARTSAFSFKGKNATAQEIGQKLGVAYLVEGSVRKAGDTVRIAARLTQASTGEEQWSENYTRNLQDVFAVQTELAQTIVEKVRGQLTTGAANPTNKADIQAAVRAAEKGGTKNVEAHEAYLQGRFFMNRHSEKETEQARAAFERAVQLDGQFALAWAGLAQTHIWDCNYATEGGQKSFNAHLAGAREAVAKSLTIEPDLPEALSAHATIEINFDSDWKGAAETLRKALALAPQDPALLAWAGNLAGARGEVEQSVDLLRRAVTLDPVNAQLRAFLAANLTSLNRQDEARAEYMRAIELNPSAPDSYAAIGLTYVVDGKFEEGVAAAQKDAADWARLLVVSCARWGQKRVAESDAALKELIATNSETAAYQIAEVYGYRNEKDKAFEWLERARRQRDAGLPALRPDILLTNLHGDPRWEAFLRTVGLADDQLK
jgi:class 3 adenylate cyclase/Tfp pilus assembly protein PilF